MPAREDDMETHFRVCKLSSLIILLESNFSLFHFFIMIAFFTISNCLFSCLRPRDNFVFIKIRLSESWVW